MTPEGKVKAEIKQALSEFNCWYVMPNMNGYGRAGIPDYIGCYKGVFFAIEAKAQFGTLTPAQSREIDAIKCIGGRVIVARDGAAVRELLHAIDLQ